MKLSVEAQKCRVGILISFVQIVNAQTLVAFKVFEVMGFKRIVGKR